jgi:hypothetical protein
MDYDEYRTILLPGQTVTDYGSPSPEPPPPDPSELETIVVASREDVILGPRFVEIGAPFMDMVWFMGTPVVPGSARFSFPDGMVFADAGMSADTEMFSFVCNGTEVHLDYRKGEVRFGIVNPAHFSVQVLYVGGMVAELPKKELE